MKFVLEISLDAPEHIDNVQNIAEVIKNMLKGFGPVYSTESLSEYYKNNPPVHRHVIYESRPDGTEDILVRGYVVNESVEGESSAIYSPEKYIASKDTLEFVSERKP